MLCAEFYLPPLCTISPCCLALPPLPCPALHYYPLSLFALCLHVAGAFLAFVPAFILSFTTIDHTFHTLLLLLSMPASCLYYLLLPPTCLLCLISSSSHSPTHCAPHSLLGSTLHYMTFAVVTRPSVKRALNRLGDLLWVLGRRGACRASTVAWRDLVSLGEASLGDLVAGLVGDSGMASRFAL